MFGSLFHRKPKGLGIESLAALCERRLEDALQIAKGRVAAGQSGVLWQTVMVKDEVVIVKWRKYFYASAANVVSTKDFDGQKIELRRLVLDIGRSRAKDRAFLLKGDGYINGRSLDERRALLVEWRDDGKDVDALTDHYIEQLAIKECSIDMIRHIQQSLFQDATTTDYFAFFSHISGQFWDYKAEVTIANASGRFHVAESFLPYYEKQMDDISAQAVAGGNFHYDLEKMKKEEAAEEAAKQRETAARKAAEPRKSASITDNQIQEIAARLVSRVSLIAQGELYTVDSLPPSRPELAFIVETGMVLVGLRETLQGDDEADKALRAIIARAIGNSASSAEHDNADVSQQREVADLARQQVSDGWLGYAAVMAAAFMHPDLYQASNPDTLEGRRQWGGECFQVVNDLWVPYAYAKRAFGWDMTETLFNEPT